MIPKIYKHNHLNPRCACGGPGGGGGGGGDNS